MNQSSKQNDILTSLALYFLFLLNQLHGTLIAAVFNLTDLIILFQ